MPFVQGTSNFKLYTIKEHENSGTHNVSVALWQSGGCATSVIRALPVNEFNEFNRGQRRGGNRGSGG